MAIDLVPIEFGRVESVMTAWEAFTHAANHNAADKAVVDKLVTEMMLALGDSQHASGQVARGDYVSTALGDQRALVAGVLKGVVSLANSSRISAQAGAAIAKHVTGSRFTRLKAE